MAHLGNFLRLHPVHTNELPDHPALNSLINGPKGKQASNGSTPTNGAITRPDLRQFVTHILTESSYFLDEAVLKTFANKGERKSPPSYNGVELLTHTYTQQEMEAVPWRSADVPRQWSSGGPKPAENWFGRRSRHANHSEDGTATFSEFDYGLRYQHSEHEMAYTPDVYDCHEVLNYNMELQDSMELDGAIRCGGSVGFTDVRMSVREMCHKLPFPLSPRTFPVLVMTAKGPQRHSLTVVQIPIDISNLTSALYSTGRNRTEGSSSIKRKGVVLGYGARIVRRVPLLIRCV